MYTHNNITLINPATHTQFNSQVYWERLVQFSTKPLFYSDISPFIFICGIFIVSNQRFIVVYYGLSLIVVRDGLGIQGQAMNTSFKMLIEGSSQNWCSLVCIEKNKRYICGLSSIVLRDIHAYKDKR